VADGRTVLEFAVALSTGRAGAARLAPAARGDGETDRHGVALDDALRLAHRVLDREDVPAVAGQQRRLPRGLPDAGAHRDRAPAVRGRGRLDADGVAAVRGHGQPVVRRRSPPLEQLGAELEIHAGDATGREGRRGQDGAVAEGFPTIELTPDELRE